MIAKDGAHTLGPCLDSIRPYARQIVVCVDERTTDNTKRVARSHGAEVYDVAVSHEHTCDYHGTVWAQHFANARTESFRHLDPSLEWWMWLDADDVVQGGENLGAMLGAVDKRYCAIWLPYVYSTIEGRSNTEFHRERLLRTRIQRGDEIVPQGWQWRYRVHEVIAPVPDGPMFGSDTVKIVHQEGVHRTENSARRNLLLLELDLEEDPHDARATFYMGNQYFAMGDWANAAKWYEQLLGLRHGNMYERWQTAVYLSMAYERLGNLEMATQSAFVALDEAPWHPEPYYRLAAINLAAGRWDHVEHWTDLGRTKTKEPPFFVFKNQLDYTFNNRVCLADAYSQLGRLEEAEAELRAAEAILPDPNVQRALVAYGEQKQIIDRANAFIGGARAGLEGEALAQLYEQQPLEVRAIPQVRQIVMPGLLKGRGDTQPRIVFWCGRSVEEWAPPKVDESGIGGSETAVIQIARKFAQDGWRADVYNGAGRYEGVYDGVGYWDPERYVDQQQHVFVAWRQPVIPASPESVASLLWCHDLNYGPQSIEAVRSWCRADGRVLGVSDWHAQMLHRYYDLPEDHVGYVPNGIDLERFRSDVTRVPMRCVYASSTDRGLVRLLGLWPRVRATESAAELHIAYGWETIDRMIALGRVDLADFKMQTERLIAETEGVVWHGRLPQDELAALYQSAYCWTYPTSFLEVSCISAMEAMAGGAVPVTAAVGALRETVGNAGVLVPGLPDSRVWRDAYTTILLGVLTNPVERERYRLRGFERALQCTWDIAYEQHWKPLVDSLLSGVKEPELVCA